MQVPHTHYSTLKLRFPGFSRDKEKSKSEQPAVNSDVVSCVRCSGRTAKLLLITGQFNFYYCYRCRHWYQSHFSARNTLWPVHNSRIENSLTWFWMSEREMMNENIRAIDWMRSIFTGRKPDEEKSKLV